MATITQGERRDVKARGGSRVRLTGSEYPAAQNVWHWGATEGTGAEQEALISSCSPSPAVHHRVLDHLNAPSSGLQPWGCLV